MMPLCTLLVLTCILLCAKSFGWHARRHFRGYKSINQSSSSSSSSSSDAIITDIANALNCNGALLSSSTAPSSSVDVVKLSTDIQKASLAMMSEGLSSDGKAVDYSAMRVSESFKEYRDMVSMLRGVDLMTLALCTDAQKSVFFINLYNSLIVHANIAIGPPQNSPQQRSLFFSGRTGAYYDIGGCAFSPDDIEHGVLRCNAFHKSAHNDFDETQKYFGRDSGGGGGGSGVRGALALSRADCRFHFVLNCGAASCPPIRILSESNLERALALASRSYLRSEVILKSNGNATSSLLLPKLLLWYGKDFGSNKQELLAKVLELIRSTGSGDNALYEFLETNSHRLDAIDVEWRDYDWSINSI